MELTSEQEQLIHRNVQASNAILSALSPEEFNKVDGLEEAKEIWDTLQLAHEGSPAIREAKIELLEGRLGRFVMDDKETPQEMYDRMMILVNKIKGLGSEDMTNHFVVKRLLRAFGPRNPTLVSMIWERKDFKRLTPNDILGRIVSHEMQEEEAREVRQMVKNAAMIKNQEVALKANQEEESSCEESEDGEMAFIVKRFKHFLRKSGYGKGRKDDDKGKRQSKRACFNCGEYGHFIADCPKSNEAKAKGGKKKPERAHVAEAHMAEVWYSGDEEDPEVKPKPKSKDKVEGEGGVATIAFKSSSSSKERLFNNLSDDDDDSYHYSCFMAQGRKVMTQKPSHTSLDVDSSDEESDNELDDVLKSLSKPAMQHLAKLMRALDSKEQSLERQEDLLILKKKRNLDLEESLTKEYAKNEQLANDLNLANGSLASLRDVNETLQEKFSCLDKSHKDLEVQFDTLWNSTSQPNVVSNSSNPSTSNGCVRCYNIYLNSYATNIDAMQALKKENERLGTLVKYGCMKTYHSKDALYKTITAHPNKDGHGLGFSGGSPVSKRVMVNGKESLMFVREGKAPQASEVTNLVSSQGPGTSRQTGQNLRVGVSVSQKFPPGSSGRFARRFRANGRAQDMTGSSGHNARRFRPDGLYYDSYVISKNSEGKVVAYFNGNYNDEYRTCVWVPKALAYSSGGSCWVVDSGCTNHMTGERSMFTSLDKENGTRENIVFGDDGKGKLGYNCLFTDEDVTVFRRDDSSVAFKGKLKGDLYLVDFDVDRVNPEACLIAKSSMGWLWHRRLAHVGIRNLATLLKGEHILGLINVTFEKDRVCSACQAGKQVGNPHPIKNIMTTTRPFELLHMDLFRPVAYISIGDNKYGFVIVDDFSRFTWVYFLHDKSEAQDVFKHFAKQAQNLYDLTIKRWESSTSSPPPMILLKRFEMSMMGELTFFLGLQVKQAQEDTFISQTKYVKDILKKFGMEDAKPIKTPMPTNGHLDLDDNGKCVDQKGCDFKLLGYSDSDYAGCKVDRKSTTGTCQFLGRSLVSWSFKKQNSITLSTAETEYVAAGSCCAQLLWMKQTLKVFGYNFTKIPLLCDNESAIKIDNNPVQHSRTKHIDIRHHFLRDHETKGDICLTHVRTESQLADIFTKPLDEKRFCELRSELNILDSRNIR
uniref:OSIGBa0140A01.8 protein n=1 Tax=Oryza sativa TaxID=4530 RepID=Q01KT1_ORYSA|nr:OSIGBa0140A01.8 [Oryza sativa]